jgi:hypothetical protein
VTYGLPLQTGADALFVMNYPAYVGESTVDAEYHSSHPGLGYKYTSEQVEPPNFNGVASKWNKRVRT